jgi:hypothetical protein
MAFVGFDIGYLESFASKKVGSARTHARTHAPSVCFVSLRLLRLLSSLERLHNVPPIIFPIYAYALGTGVTSCFGTWYVQKYTDGVRSTV